MHPPLRVLIMGSSLFALALESTLMELTDRRPVRIDPMRQELLVRHITEEPFCVFLEEGALTVQQMWGLIQQGHILVEIDAATTNCTTIYRRSHALMDNADVERLLQHLADCTYR